MRLKTPSFWYRETGGIKSIALWVPSQLYRLAHIIHHKIVSPYRAKIPVICIGNLVAGGSGKTPTAIAVAQIIRGTSLAKNPCFLTRGYGRDNTKEVFVVDPSRHNADDAGDESLLLARQLPTIVAADRRQGAALAEHSGHDLIIMDDGMQNPGITKDICITVISGATGLGNRKLLPAGPLREPLAKGMARSDAFIIIGADIKNTAALLTAGKPVFNAAIKVPNSWNGGDASTSLPYIAFCGLGQPEKFFHTLEEHGLNIIKTISFPDHHRFSRSELRGLAEQAQANNARLITTEKDAARLTPDMIQELAGRILLDILPITIEWEDSTALTAFLKQTMPDRK